MFNFGETIEKVKKVFRRESLTTKEVLVKFLEANLLALEKAIELDEKQAQRQIREILKLGENGRIPIGDEQCDLVFNIIKNIQSFLEKSDDMFFKSALGQKFVLDLNETVLEFKERIGRLLSWIKGEN